MASPPTDDIRHALDRLFRGGASGGATDAQLLERFLAGPDDRAADAFAMLVVRHEPAILRACRRVLDNPQDAEDATQAAFLILARRARSIRSRDSVASFLLGTALHLALRLRADAARRRKHEYRRAETAAQRSPRPDRDDDWTILYEEIDRLPKPCRAPLVLCYLEGLTNEQAAGRLRLPLRTLQRRLAQARERLRRRLDRRGVAPALALLTTSADPLVANLPLAWAEATGRAAARLISGRSAAGLVTASALTLTQEAIHAMLRAKFQLALASLLALGTLAAGFSARAGRSGPDDPPATPVALGQQARSQVVTADGRAPQVVQSTALAPDGHPLVGALVLTSGPEDRLSLHHGEIPNRVSTSQPGLFTADDGTFPLSPNVGEGVVVVLGERAWGLADQKALARSKTLTTRPYAQVEGRMLVAGLPAAHRKVVCSGEMQGETSNPWAISERLTSTTDADGRFSFPKVIPMADLHVAPQTPEPDGRLRWTLGEGVIVEPGATAQITLGQSGRPVVGRVELPPGWDRPVDYTQATATLGSHRAGMPYPPELFRDQTDPAGVNLTQWERDWCATPEGRASMTARVEIVVRLAPDGSFRFDDVPPGSYDVVVRFASVPDLRDLVRLQAPFRLVDVPPAPSVEPKAPLDLGTLAFREKTPLDIGLPAPPFEVTTTSGEHRKVPADFAGKYLLIEFATTASLQSRLDIARLNGVRARFGDDPRLALLTLTMDPDTPETRAYVAAKGQPWPQAIIDSPTGPIASAYSGSSFAAMPGMSIGPAAVLVGPDGRIVAAGLRYEQITDAVATALGREP